MYRAHLGFVPGGFLALCCVTVMCGNKFIGNVPTNLIIRGFGSLKAFLGTRTRNFRSRRPIPCLWAGILGRVGIKGCDEVGNAHNAGGTDHKLHRFFRANWLGAFVVLITSLSEALPLWVNLRVAIKVGSKMWNHF